MDNRRYYILTVLQIVGAAYLLWFLFSMSTPWDLQRNIGSMLVVAGVAGIAVARYQLGRSFAIRAEAHQLETHGVYSKIRNPIYVFGAVVIAGIVLATHHPTLALPLLFILIVQILRARREAQVLEAAFGDAYREYRRKTWF